MEIVINASPLILLDKINRLYLLDMLFDVVYVPTAVLREVEAGTESNIISKLSQISYKQLAISNRVAVSSLLGRLHVGEVEVIIGAIENGIKTVVLDDNTARNKAKQLGLNVT